MKKIIFLIVYAFLSTGIVNANGVDLYGEADRSWGLGEKQVSQIKTKINDIQTKTGLNTDIIILGKGDSKSCYLDYNFDSCVKDSYSYSSDLIVVLKMKSDISDRGDIRSLMDNKNYPIITTNQLKNIQDSIVYNFKENNFQKGIIEYLDNLITYIGSTCNSMLSENKKLGGDYSNKNCTITNLQKLLVKNGILREEAKTRASFIRNIYIVVSILLFLGFIKGLRMFYSAKIKNLFKDIKFKIIDLDKGSTFKSDFKKYSDSLNVLVRKLEVYLANADKGWIKQKKYYREISLEFENIKKVYNESITNFKSQDDLKQKLKDFKETNI